MPKVLRIINRFNLGGPTYNAAYLTKYMEPEYETLLVGGEKDESEGSSECILEQLGINYVVVPEMKRSINYQNDKLAYQKVKQIIQEFKPDIVHTHASKAGTIGRLAAAKCGVPVIVHTFHGHVFHSYFGKAKTLFYKSIERYLAKKSTRIIAISEKQKQELTEIHKICRKDKMSVVRLGFDLKRFNENKEEKRNAFRDQYQIQPDEIAVGIIGRLVPIKNHSMFLRIIKEVLNKTDKKVRAFIIGDGESKEDLTAYCDELSIDYSEWNKQPKVAPLTFTSWIKDIDRANAGLDIVVLTSLNEGTPVSLIEAQASGTPVVSTNVGGVENIIINNETGLICELGDEQTFIKQLLSLVENNELRENMSKKGWTFAMENFHYTRLVKDMKILYAELLNN